MYIPVGSCAGAGAVGCQESSYYTRRFVLDDAEGSDRVAGGGLVGHMSGKASKACLNPLRVLHCDLMLTALGVSSSLAKYMALAYRKQSSSLKAWYSSAFSLRYGGGEREHGEKRCQ